jgi:two-component system heavy metal sensor histidine kinase CusS
MNDALSITARVSLLFAAAAAAVLLLAGVMFERATQSHFLEDDQRELSGKFDLIRDLLANADSASGKAQLPTRIADAMFGHPGIAISIVSRDGGVIFAAGPQAVLNRMRADPKAGEAQLDSWSDGARFYRLMQGRFALGVSDRAPVRVSVALDITEDHAFLVRFRKLLWLGMVLAMLVVGLLGWIAVRGGLLPLRRLSDEVAAISAKRLGAPLSEDGIPTELSQLVRAFNRMLARLEDSFQRISEFSADLAHELRTPIQNLLVQTQVTLSRERDAEEYRGTLQSNLEELERMSRMVADMLFLAKADNKLVALRREPVDLGREFEKLLAFYEPYASERGVLLCRSGSATVVADRLMIQRAVSNLISNAIRFTPAGKTVSVDVSEGAGWAEIKVSNPGPQIPAAKLSKLFERLYRGDPARREGDTEHVGLGLAIAKSIAEIHGGRIQVSSDTDGTSFDLSLPLVTLPGAESQIDTHSTASAA